MIFYFEYNLKSQVHHPPVIKSKINSEANEMRPLNRRFSVNRYVYTTVTLYVNPSATAAIIVIDRFSY